MRGLWITGSLTTLLALALTYVLWPSRADFDRRLHELDRELNELGEILAETATNVRTIAQHKPANRLKSRTETLKRAAELIRHQTRRLQESTSHPATSEEMHRLADLRSQCEGQIKDAADLRARTRELLIAIKTLSPLVNEGERLTIHLSKKLERLGAEGSSPDQLKDLREAIETYSGHRELVIKAFDAFSDKIADGRVLTKTAANEIQATLERMRELADS